MTSSHTQLAFNLERESLYAQEDFFRGVSNDRAFQAIIEKKAWGKACGQLLVGPSGSGKTHLARIWQELNHGIFLNLPHCLEEGKEHLESAQKRVAFILDDFPGNVLEQDVFHLYNLVCEHQGALLILSQTLPQEWPLVLLDLKSRLYSLPLQTLETPDDEVLRAVLRKRFADFQIAVPENVISYVLPRMERSFKSVQDFARRLNMETLAQKKNATLTMARACLEQSC
jgi:chromosomal replication initiation ATPase DnaA